MNQPSAQECLSELSMPTLILTGSEEMNDLLLIAEELADNIPNSKKLSVPNTGHLPKWEDPVETNTKVRDFILEYCKSVGGIA